MANTNWKTWGVLAGLLVLGCVFGVNERAVLKHRHVAQAMRLSVAQPNQFEILVQKTWYVTAGKGGGTGVATRLSDGRIVVLTAAHVVKDATAMTLQRETRGDRGPKSILMVKADVLKVWADWDIAVLLPHAPELFTALAERDLTEPRLGDPVIHVGNYYGPNFGFSIAVGIVSNLRVFPGQIDEWPWKYPLDQTSAAFLPGSSGGPVFNQASKLIGIAVGSAGHDGAVNVYVPMRDVEKLLAGLK